MGAARTAAMIALGFVGLSGLVGGIPLIAHAHGEPWWMLQSLLRYSPFDSYLIPGLILFSTIGLLSCWVFWMALRRLPGYGRWVTFEGCILLGWLVVEVIMIRVAAWPHYFYAAVALALILSGMILVREPVRATR